MLVRNLKLWRVNRLLKKAIHHLRIRVDYDTETGVLIGIPMSASCVQRLDDSLNMQFTLVIALCYVLHRCENQEIHY